MTLETYSGDGDMFNLGDEGAEAMVTFVNAIHTERSNAESSYRSGPVAASNKPAAQSAHSD